MPFMTRRSLLALGALSAVAALAAAGFVWSGVYDVGADDRHTRPVYALMQAMRDRSIEVRASRLKVPDLEDPERIRQGAGNYDAMCVGCHLAPGMDATELSKGLYPAPPDLTRETVEGARAFWVIKHGIKASGMPAWGNSMGDDYIWNMAAFVQVLPGLTPADYRSLVASSEGHSHGGGESHPHAQADGAPADHHGPAAARPGHTPAPDMVEHRHADGTVESHPAPQPAPAPADDGHDHQH